jgi:uncharacterized integral membrane protein (TIGR00698 family)
MAGVPLRALWRRVPTLVRTSRLSAELSRSWPSARRAVAARCLSGAPGGGARDDEEGKAAGALRAASLVDAALGAAPGLAASAAVMSVGFAAADVLGMQLLALQGISGDVASPLSGIPVSILLGMALKNSLPLPKALEPGLKVASKVVLQSGIVCVAAKLSAVDLVTVGLVGLPAVCVSIGAGLTFIPWFSARLGLPAKMGSLMAAGMSICGVTAITALAPAINASQRDTSFAVANVVAFGTAGMLVFPYVAHALLPTSQQVGIFLGLCVQDTSQVIGTALTYSTVYGDETALKVATVTKLTRNLFLAGVIPGLTYLTATREAAAATSASSGAAAAGTGAGSGAGAATSKPASLIPSFAEAKKYFPGFVGAFVAMSALRTAGDMTLASSGAALGLLDADSWSHLHKFVGNDLGSKYLLGTAMAAVGLSTSLSALKGVGYKPFVVGAASVGVVGGTGFLSATVLGAFL